MGRPNPRLETNIKARTGTGKGKLNKKSQIGGKSWRANGSGEAEQSGASCNRAKGGIEDVRVDGRSQLPRITHGVGRVLDILSVYDRLGCDVVGLQETRRSGPSAWLATWCTAAMSAVTRMVGRNGKVE